jgi:hypothetical protein
MAKKLLLVNPINPGRVGFPVKASSCFQPLFSYGNQDKQIAKYLETKEFVLDSLEKLNGGDNVG